MVRVLGLKNKREFALLKEADKYLILFNVCVFFLGCILLEVKVLNTWSCIEDIKVVLGGWGFLFSLEVRNAPSPGFHDKNLKRKKKSL